MHSTDKDKIRDYSKGSFKTKPAAKYAEITHAVESVAGDLIAHLKGSSIEKAANWAIQGDSWLNNEASPLAVQGFYTYSRGDVIYSINYGTTRFGTEIRYPHPGVVLYNDLDWVLVIPITAATFDKTTNDLILHKPYDVYSDKGGADGEYQFQKPSVIQVDQLTKVSKKRIEDKRCDKLRSDLLNEIDNIITEYYLPKKHAHIQDLRAKLNRRDEEILELRKEIERMKALLPTQLE